MSEPTESFTVGLASPVGATLGATPTHTVTILDDDGVVNDSFAGPIQMYGSGWATTGTNGGATLEGGEPDHAGGPQGASVWWRWVAPRSGTVSVNTFGSDFDTVLGIYSGTSVGALTTVASNDDTDGRQSMVQFAAVAGRDYAIAVAGYSAWTGNTALALSLYSGSSDFGGDGKTDILWRESASGATYLWLMNGGSTISTAYTAAHADNTWTIQNP